MTAGSTASAPDALLVIGPGCPHCAVVLEGLSRLVKEGGIGTLEVVNAAARPEQAQALQVRSVPWTRVGAFQFEGAMSLDELRTWAARAGTEEGLTRYIEYQLGSGRLPQVVTLLKQHPDWVRALPPLVGDMAVSMHVRVGVGAVLESLAGTESLSQLVPDLGKLTGHPDPRARSDACHYLALTRRPEALAYLRGCIQDDSAEVREVAAEAIQTLEQSRR
jgi:HEAT repeats/Thioredoxin domain